MHAKALLVVSILCGVLAGCHGSRDKFKDQSQRIALSGPITGVVKDQRSTTRWSLINERRVNVTACLNEQAMQRPVGVHEWVVQGPGLDTDARSTTQGCLTWVEKLEFEPSARPAYIPLKRTLRARDAQFTPLEINFAVNPWSDFNGSEAVVLDPSFSESKFLANENEAAAQLAGIERSGRLAISSVSHTLLAQPRLKLSVRLKPELHTWTMSGADAILEIESGRMDIRIQLAYRGSDGSALLPLHREILLAAQDFRNGVLDLKELSLEGLAKTDKTKGTYYLLLSLMPVEATAGLKPFTGTIALGDWTQLRGGTNSDKEETRPTVVEPIGQLPSAPGGGFSLGLIQGATYGPADENVVFRRIQLTMHVHVMGASLGDSLEDEEFEISSVDQPTASVRRKVLNGELSWQDSVLHNYYAPMSTPLKKDVVFTRVKTGQKIKKTIDLTPWVRFLLVIVDTDGANASVNGPGKPLDDPKTDRRAQIRLESPCASAGDTRYSVDAETLDLKLGLQPFFQFSPTVRRFDEPFFGMNTFDGPGLRAGYYMLTLAVYNLDYADLTTPVAITQKIVLHLGGNLSTQVTLNTKDLSLTRLRNYVVAQINFLDPASLRDAEGRPVDPLKAFQERVPVTQGRVMSQSELNVNFPLNIFPLVLSSDSCAATPAQGGFDNPELRKLSDLIRKGGIDLLAIAKGAAVPAAQKPDPNGWKGAAAEWGLEAVELIKPADARKMGFDKDFPIAEIESGLECAFQANEQDPKMPAKCLYENTGPMWELCRAIAINWYDRLDREQTRRFGEARLRREYVISPAFLNHCMNNTRKHMKVRKYVHVLELARSEDVEITGGSVPLGVTLKTAFAIGTDRGTEHMHEDLNRLAVSLKLNADGAGATKGIMRIFSAAPSGANVPTAEVLNAIEKQLKNIGGLDSSAGVKFQIKPFAKTQDSFRWIFNYEIPYSMSVLTSSSSLTLENLSVNLEVLRHRTCYTIEPSIEDEEWEGLLVPYSQGEAPTPRLYVCFPENREPRRMEERYFFVYNSPPAAQGVMNDNDRGRNRWMLSFRGQRDFGVFMTNLRPHIKSYYRDNNAAMDPIDPMIDSIREGQLMDKTMYPAAVAAPAPSLDSYDSIYNLEGYVPKVLRWLSETFNPFEDNDAPVLNDQNAPDTRKYRTNKL